MKYFNKIYWNEDGADTLIAENYNDNFSQHPWQNPTRAREILNTALQNVVNPS